MRKLLIATLLKALNSSWLNNSPCQYGFIGNVDAFSYGHLASEEKQRPGITVKQVLEEADRFRSCPLRSDGLAVIEGDQVREGTIWDVRDLRASLSKKPEA